MNAEIAIRIKRIREYRNYSQSYVAAKLKIRQNTYSKIENGITPIQLPRLEKIAKILDVSVEDILNKDMPLFFLEKRNENKNVNVLLEKIFYEIQSVKEQNKTIIETLQIKTNIRTKTSLNNKKKKK